MNDHSDFRYFNDSSGKGVECNAGIKPIYLIRMAVVSAILIFEVLFIFTGLFIKNQNKNEEALPKGSTKNAMKKYPGDFSPPELTVNYYTEISGDDFSLYIKVKGDLEEGEKLAFFLSDPIGTKKAIGEITKKSFKENYNDFTKETILYHTFFSTKALNIGKYAITATSFLAKKDVGKWTFELLFNSLDITGATFSFKDIDRKHKTIDRMMLTLNKDSDIPITISQDWNVIEFKFNDTSLKSKAIFRKLHPTHSLDGSSNNYTFIKSKTHHIDLLMGDSDSLYIPVGNKCHIGIKIYYYLENKLTFAEFSKEIEIK